MSENPNANRRVSTCGFKLIKSWEGLFLSAYYDPVGVLTIGYGHTNLSGVGPKVVPGMRLKDRAEAEAILARVLKQVYEPALRRHIKVPLNQHQWDAMVSWIYNLGETNFAKSTMLKRINAGRFDAVPAEIMKYTRAGGKVYKGLVNRRRAEAGMWRGLGVNACLPIDGVTDTTSVREIDQPAPEPVTDTDKIIEKVGVSAPIITTLLSAVQDWKVAAVFGTLAVAVLIFLYVKNRSED